MSDKGPARPSTQEHYKSNCEPLLHSTTRHSDGYRLYRTAARAPWIPASNQLLGDACFCLVFPFGPFGRGRQLAILSLSSISIASSTGAKVIRELQRAGGELSTSSTSSYPEAKPALPFCLNLARLDLDPPRIDLICLDLICFNLISLALSRGPSPEARSPIPSHPIPVPVQRSGHNPPALSTPPQPHTWLALAHGTRHTHSEWPGRREAHPPCLGLALPCLALHWSVSASCLVHQGSDQSASWSPSPRPVSDGGPLPDLVLPSLSLSPSHLTSHESFI